MDTLIYYGFPPLVLMRCAAAAHSSRTFHFPLASSEVAHVFAASQATFSIGWRRVRATTAGALPVTATTEAPIPYIPHILTRINVATRNRGCGVRARCAGQPAWMRRLTSHIISIVCLCQSLLGNPGYYGHIPNIQLRVGIRPSRSCTHLVTFVPFHGRKGKRGVVVLLLRRLRWQPCLRQRARVQNTPFAIAYRLSSTARCRPLATNLPTHHD